MAEKKEQPAAEVEQAKKADETIAGGAYMVNGVLVNCDGEPVEAKKK